MRIGNLEATVLSATETELVVATPYGVKTGKVSVKVSGQGESTSREDLRAKTSISGFVTDTAQPPQGLRGVTVTVQTPGGTQFEERTRPDGSFVVSGMPSGSVFVKIDSSTADSRLPYPALQIKMRVYPNQDNRFSAPFALQQITGEGTGVAGSNLRPASANQKAARAQQTIQLKTGCDQKQQNCVVLEIPEGAVLNPRAINLTLVEQSRVPAKLPPGVFSPRIVQITPFDAAINPGAKLVFPNVDGLPPGARVSLFQFDKEQEINSPAVFKELAGAATVSVDGARLETAASEIKAGSYYFVAAPQLVTTAVGRVVDGARPVQQVITQVRGQNNFTDGNGGFASPGVAVKPGDTLQAEVSYQRPEGGIVYTFKPREANADGVTNFGDIPLREINPNRPPRLNLPEQISLAPGESLDVPFYAFDEQDGDRLTYQMTFIPVSLPDANANANFASMSVLPAAANNYKGLLRFVPTEGDIGEYQFKLTVQDDGGANQLAVTKVLGINVVGRPGSFTLASAVACDFNTPSGPVVRLTWTQSPRAHSYDVLRNGVPIRQGLTALRFDDKDLAVGDSYSYQVIARNSLGMRKAEPVGVAVPREICNSSLVTVSLAAPTSATGSSILIPVQLGDISERDVIAFEFELSFDPNILQFQELDRAGTLSEGITILRKIIPDGELNVLRVVAYSTRPFSGANRDLVRLRFNVVGVSGASTPLIWRRFMPNEGNPLVAAVNGRFTVQ